MVADSVVVLVKSHPWVSNWVVLLLSEAGYWKTVVLSSYKHLCCVRRLRSVGLDLEQMAKPVHSFLVLKLDRGRLVDCHQCVDLDLVVDCL